MSPIEILALPAIVIGLAVALNAFGVGVTTPRFIAKDRRQREVVFPLTSDSLSHFYKTHGHKTIDDPGLGISEVLNLIREMDKERSADAGASPQRPDDGTSEAQA